MVVTDKPRSYGAAFRHLRLTFYHEQGLLIRLRRGGDTAHIEVSDRGPGVPPAQLEQIFERYFSSRLSADENKPSDRFGIGLSIARRNVEAMYGTIGVPLTPHGLIVHIR